MYKFKNIFGEDPRTLRLKVSEGGKATFYAVREGSVQHRGRREGRGGGGRVWCSENLSTLQLKFLVAPLHPSIHPSVHPSIRPSVRLSVCLSVYLSVCLSVP